MQELTKGKALDVFPNLGIAILHLDLEHHTAIQKHLQSMPYATAAVFIDYLSLAAKQNESLSPMIQIPNAYRMLFPGRRIQLAVIDRASLSKTYSAYWTFMHCRAVLQEDHQPRWQYLFRIESSSDDRYGDGGSNCYSPIASKEVLYNTSTALPHRQLDLNA